MQRREKARKTPWPYILFSIVSCDFLWNLSGVILSEGSILDYPPPNGLVSYYLVLPYGCFFKNQRMLHEIENNML